MRILLVNKFLHPNGGSETYIFKIGNQLERAGHEVEYFGMDHPERTVGNRLECYTSPMDFHSGKMSKVIYPFKIIYSMEAYRKMTRVLEDFSPDVVHLNNFNFQLTPSIIYAVKDYRKKNNKKVKLLFTAHDYQLVCPNHMLRIPESGELCLRCIDGKTSNCMRYRCIHQSFFRSVLAAAEARLYQVLGTYRYIDMVICPSRFMAKILEHNRKLQNKLVVRHNFLEKKSDRNEKPGGDYVLYFGRYAEEKGIKVLLEACGKLPDIPFVFAGSGPLEKEINGIANVTNLGFLDSEQIQKVIQKARFVVFPSVWYENCPFSVMEAQLYSTPVVGSNLGGTPELIGNHVTGELYDGMSAQELTRKIKDLWNDPDRCSKYAENCDQITFDTLEDYVKKLIPLYEEPERNS